MFQIEPNRNTMTANSTAFLAYLFTAHDCVMPASCSLCQPNSKWTGFPLYYFWNALSWHKFKQRSDNGEKILFQVNLFRTEYQNFKDDVPHVKNKCLMLTANAAAFYTRPDMNQWHYLIFKSNLTLRTNVLSYPLISLTWQSKLLVAMDWFIAQNNQKCTLFTCWVDRPEEIRFMFTSLSFSFISLNKQHTW